MIKALQEIKEIEVLPLEESIKILRDIESEEQEKAGTDPVVVITIWNGLLDDVEANIPCKVIVLEYDKYVDARAEASAWAKFGGYDYSVRKWNVKADPQGINDVVQGVGGVT